MNWETDLLNLVREWCAKAQWNDGCDPSIDTYAHYALQTVCRMLGEVQTGKISKEQFTRNMLSWTYNVPPYIIAEMLESIEK